MPLAGLAALLDAEADLAPGFPAPLLSHWLFFSPLARQSDLDEDGHAPGGEFLPPIALPQRLWTGSTIRFHRPIRVDDEIHRISRIQSVSVKQGRCGPVASVAVHHQIHGPQGHAITEEQDVVYRSPAAAAARRTEAAPPAGQECFSRTVRPDPALLFRYSALTFNTHRIHYDRTYVTEVAQYPGLVVHAALTATLLLDLFQRQRPRASVRRYRFEVLHPLFDGAPVALCGRWSSEQGAELWARDAAGAVAMRATVETH